MAYTDLIAGGAFYQLSDRLLISQTLINVSKKYFSNDLIHYVTIIDTVTGAIIPDPNRVEITSNIVVSHQIDFEITKDFYTNVVVAQTINYTIERVINLIDTLPITDYVIKYIDKLDVNGNPVSANTGDVYVDPGVFAYQSGLTPGNTVSFTDGGNILTLHKPEFGDTDSYQQYRIQRTTLGGDPLQIYKDPMWPTYESFDLTWNYMSEDDKNNLITFLTTSLGKKITFINHFGETFQGYIITPFEQIVQPKRVGWSANFKFQIYIDPNPVVT